MEDDKAMVTFDVTSLYTNIPIVETINTIKDYVNNEDQFTRENAVSQDKFLDLVALVLTTTWYTFNSQFYQPTDGIAIRQREIYVQALEQIAVFTALQYRKV